MRAPSNRKAACRARPTLEALEQRELLSIASLPRPDHVVILIEENHAYSQIIGSANAPYINSQAQAGALFTQSFALSHPSQPNYIQFFSGSNQGVTNDNCLTTPFRTANLGAELLQAGYTFAGYSEDLPTVGSTTCTSGQYARKHNPWVDWQGSTANGIPTSSNLRFTDFPSDFSTLPTLSFVVPNQNDDMHNGTDPTTIRTGDAWAQTHLNAYVQWAQSNNSLLIVTFDEDNSASGNQIATLFVGPMVAPGRYSQHITHYDVLRTLEDLYGLPYAGASATATALTNVWTNPWQEQDVGSAGLGGGSFYWDVYSTYFLQGAGAGGDTADAFHYVYQTLHGDGWILAEVSGVDFTDPGALAGVTIRESLAAGSAQATMAVRADGGSQFTSRDTTDGSSSVTSGPSVGTPSQVYLERVGGDLNGSVYSDATGWVGVGSATISMAADVSIGLAVTSNTTAALANGTFDSVYYYLGGAAPPGGGGAGRTAPAAAAAAAGHRAGALNPDRTFEALLSADGALRWSGLAGGPAFPLAPGLAVPFGDLIPQPEQEPEKGRGPARSSAPVLPGRASGEAERAVMDEALFAWVPSGLPD